MKLEYKIACVYDTETCNVGEGALTRAYPVLYILNDIRAVPIDSYAPGDCDNIVFERGYREVVRYFEELMQWGQESGVVPIVCAYNLGFDLQPILMELALRFDIKASCQSSTNIYTFDLLDDSGNPQLRFWDTYHLELGGLKAMGRTCGLSKATGDWDYRLARTPATPLTSLEYFYAARDVQVIPAYLRYLIEANEWLDEPMLGNRVITKTSLVRQMARLQIGPLKFRKSNGKTFKVGKAFELTCEQERAKTYRQYALRKACFRGGLTFTSANYAGTIQRNVLSADVTSMHHTFINGKFVPVRFHDADPRVLQRNAEAILNKTVTDVLNTYACPFNVFLHARVRFRNIRPRRGTVFERCGIWTLAKAKFQKVVDNMDTPNAEVYSATQESLIAAGYHDSAVGARFAFGKLVSADVAEVFVNEIELWCIGQVYEFGSMEVLEGELTSHSVRPPDFVSLQSNILYERKNDMKRINANYNEGEPYPLGIPASIPEAIAAQLRAGTATGSFVAAYYQSTVKGLFNAIYGSQAQDILKPDYICEEGDLSVDSGTVTTAANFDEKNASTKCRVFYNFGMRIVGNSRMHLLIAMILIDSALGSKVRITGGDTDSMKISTDAGVTDDDILAALAPLHGATRKALDLVQARVRECFPGKASELDHIGEFDIEPVDSAHGTRYALHMEAWNKARVSLDKLGKCHITCAGLSRPENEYNADRLVTDLVAKGHKFEEIAPLVLGYNTYYEYSVCHSLMKHRPLASDRFDADVTDYEGNTSRVSCYESIALYEAPRGVGETDKSSNAENVAYLESIGREVDTRPKLIGVRGIKRGPEGELLSGEPYIRFDDMFNTEIS